MEQAAGPGVYEFGRFRLDEARRILCDRTSGARVVIAPKVFDAGLYFVANAGELLPKARLLAHLWPGLVVEENSLTQTICDLRRSLGETRGENRYVVTVPRRGYQFVAEVRRISPAVARPIAPAQGCDIAVVPFGNLSGRTRDDSIATGLAESIRHRLVATTTLKLVASVGAHTGPGAHPRYVVEGSVQHWGARLRITTRLVDRVDGSQLWSLMFDRAANDLFAIEDDIASRVVQALTQSLCRPESSARTAG